MGPDRPSILWLLKKSHVSFPLPASPLSPTQRILQWLPCAVCLENIVRPCRGLGDGHLGSVMFSCSSKTSCHKGIVHAEITEPTTH